MKNLELLRPYLEKHGFKIVRSHSYTHEFMWPGTGKYIYIKKTKKLSIVFNEQDIPKPYEANQIVGYEYFNSNLVEFPRKRNRGKREEAFGIAFDLNHAADIEPIIEAFCGEKSC